MTNFEKLKSKKSLVKMFDFVYSICDALSCCDEFCDDCPFSEMCSNDLDIEEWLEREAD